MPSCFRNKPNHFLFQGNFSFQFCRRWSRPHSWFPHRVPQDGDSVTVETGQLLLLDANTSLLNLLHLKGLWSLNSLWSLRGSGKGGGRFWRSFSVWLTVYFETRLKRLLKWKVRNGRRSSKLKAVLFRSFKARSLIILFFSKTRELIVFSRSSCLAPALCSHAYPGQTPQHSKMPWNWLMLLPLKSSAKKAMSSCVYPVVVLSSWSHGKSYK